MEQGHSVTVGSVTLPNPVMTASGTAGHGGASGSPSTSLLQHFVHARNLERASAPFGPGFRAHPEQ